MMCAIPVTLVKAEPPNWGLLRETYNISYHVLLSLADKRSRAHAWWLALRRELRDVVLSCTLRLASPSQHRVPLGTACSAGAGGSEGILPLPAGHGGVKTRARAWCVSLLALFVSLLW